MTAPQGDSTAAGELLQQLVRDGFASATAVLHPMPGGVSSDVYLVEDRGGRFVVKRALPRLRVRQEWLADVSRNEYERRYLQYVGAFLPQAVPRLLGAGEGYVAMEYLGPEFQNWKTLLMSSRGTVRHAASAGAVLGAIHARSRGDAAAARDFDSAENFRQLRVDPYLLATAQAHRSVAGLITAEAQRLLATREALVHGDFSPKNMLISDDRFVLLDCEVAWYGDPAFDVAFLTTHLLLKSACLPEQRDFSAQIAAFLAAYSTSSGASEGDERSCDLRAARLAPMLLLARVDGKSPVEYLDRRQQDDVRRFALATIAENAERTMAALCQKWFNALTSSGANS